MNRRIIGGAFVIVMLVGLWLAIAPKKSEPQQSIRLADGSQLTFLKADYGSNVVFVWGKQYQQSMYKMLPARLKSWAGVSLFNFQTVFTNIPVLWLHETGGTLASTPDLRFLDVFGCDYEHSSYGLNSTLLPDSQGTLFGYQVQTSYLQGQMAGVWVGDSNGKNRRAGSFMLSGVALVNVPEIAPSNSPPQAVGDLTIQLISLASGLKAGPYLPVMSNDFYFSQAAFRITKNGTPETAWFPAKVRLIDAQGKTVRQGYRHEIGHRGDDFVYNFESTLDPAAGPLKLRAEFTHESDFSADELLTITNVPFPPAQGSTNVNAVAELQGHQITVETVHAAFTERPAELNFRPEQPYIEVQLTPATNSWHLQLVGSVNEEGQVLDCWGTAPASKGKYCFSFAPSAKAKSMKLTFAVHQSRFAEFTATPVLMPTNAPSGAR